MARSLANSGHFNVELNLSSLKEMAKQVTRVRDFVEQFTMADGRNLFVLGEGRLINLAALRVTPLP